MGSGGIIGDAHNISPNVDERYPGTQSHTRKDAQILSTELHITY